MSDDVVIAIAFFSAYGHTEALAKAIARGARDRGATVVYVPVSELEDIDWPTLNNADAILFGSPTYMGGVAAPFKSFMDASSVAWYEMRWRDKLAGGFSVSSAFAGDRHNVFVQLSAFAAQHGMIWVSLGLPPGNNSSEGSMENLNRLGVYLGAAGQANMDESSDTAPPTSDRETAHAYGMRIADITQRWVRAHRI